MLISLPLAGVVIYHIQDTSHKLETEDTVSVTDDTKAQVVTINVQGEGEYKV